MMRRLFYFVLCITSLLGGGAIYAEAFSAEGLRKAAISGDLKTIQKYIDAKFDLNKISGGIPSFNIEGSPPISAAAAEKQCAAVKLLLDGGAHADTKKKYGFTPLALAAQAGATECVEALLKKNVRLDVRTTEGGDTPLILAAYAGHLEVVKLLVSAGANTKLKNHDGDDAMGAARVMGSRSVVQYLQDLDSKKSSQSKTKAYNSSQKLPILYVSSSNGKPLKDGYIMCVSKESLDKGTQLVAQGKDNNLRSVGCYPTSSRIEGAVLDRGFLKSEVLLQFPSGESAKVWVHSEALQR